LTTVSPSGERLRLDGKASYAQAAVMAPPSLWDHLTRLLLLVGVVVVLLTFADYGLTHDEEVQAIYGEKLLSLYTSLFIDRAAFSYLDLYWYGGLFDLVAAILNKASPFGYYETRHLLGGLVGIAGLAAAWRLGRLAGGPRAGFLAALLLALTPVFYGHSFNNPKDAPFAVAMLWLVYAIAKVSGELPRPSWSTVVKLGVALGIALCIRVGALLGIGYLGLAVLAHVAVTSARWGLPEGGRSLWTATRRLLPAAVIAYILVAVFWPWAVLDPLNPIRALQHFSGYDIDIESLFAGTKVAATRLPAGYVLGYVTVTMPELLLVGFTAFALGALGWRRRRMGENGAAQALTALALAFPIGFFVAVRPTAYDGLRHFLFVVPPLVVLAAVGINRMWIWAASRSARAGTAFVGLLAAAVVAQGSVMVKLHPNEYIYYNLLVGGVAGAEGNWELDYWSNSFHEAADDVAEIVRIENGGVVPTDRVTKVRICGNDLSASYFFPPYLRLTDSPEDADFIIAFTQSDCWKTWRGRTVAEVERFGAVLAVVKDRRGLADRSED
jgi:hypothetical protein